MKISFFVLSVLVHLGAAATPRIQAPLITAVSVLSVMVATLFASAPVLEQEKTCARKFAKIVYRDKRRGGVHLTRNYIYTYAWRGDPADVDIACTRAFVQA
ncbi:uncharacterized protein RCO7_11667 [Rhynchosporium graminicola]|uniref:Uncharacterized protein n=1 Tax=Rhynchosporium graminicola TaxID=2792576 RepID=A0A1E1LHD2_9HELO|nr:uncharacterized protein RCO7_11667 [Rhynchosporium commune]